MPYQITLRTGFSAAHQLRLADGALEPLHGHNWQVRFVVARSDGGLDEIGTVHDFHDVQPRLGRVVEALHNTHLNDTPAFAEVNPTTEHVARHIAEAVRLPDDLRVVEVEVWETPDCSATWRPDGR